MFAQTDKDKDSMSQAEFVVWHKQDNLDVIHAKDRSAEFERMDKNKNLKVSKAEFVADTQDGALGEFDEFDLDKNGELNKEEFDGWWNKYAKDDDEDIEATDEAEDNEGGGDVIGDLKADEV